MAGYLAVGSAWEQYSHSLGLGSALDVYQQPDEFKTARRRHQPPTTRPATLRLWPRVSRAAGPACPRPPPPSPPPPSPPPSSLPLAGRRGERRHASRPRE